MDWTNFISFCREQVKLHPSRRSAIVELVDLAKAEIEDGGSESHEIELAIDSIKSLT